MPPGLRRGAPERFAGATQGGAVCASVTSPGRQVRRLQLWRTSLVTDSGAHLACPDDCRCDGRAPLLRPPAAEVVLGTVRDVSVAIAWLKTTFLYVRIRQNPGRYGRVTPTPAGRSARLAGIAGNTPSRGLVPHLPLSARPAQACIAGSALRAGRADSPHAIPAGLRCPQACRRQRWTAYCATSWC